MGDYYTPSGKRKTKRDKKKKKRTNVYKKGGKFRATTVKETKTKE